MDGSAADSRYVGFCVSGRSGLVFLLEPVLGEVRIFLNMKEDNRVS